MVIVDRQIKYALKEWAIAVDALSKGEMLILLRKGGIREREFQVKHSQVWLYPTYEHQKPELLKPEYAGRVTTVESGWHPNTVKIESCAKITDVLPVSSFKQVAALQPYHIWNERMIDDRLNWKPQKPLLVLLMQVYRFVEPQTITYHPSYGGCKSWIELERGISSESLVPVVKEVEYSDRTQAIKASICVE